MSAIPRRRRRSASPRSAPAAGRNASTRPRSTRWPPKSSWSAGLSAPEREIAAEPTLQTAADGRLRHLLTLQGMPRERLTALLDRADRLRTATHGGAKPLDLL